MAKSTAKKLYIAKKKIRHEGERYNVGEEISLTAEQAEQLLAIDAVVAAVTEVDKSGATVDLSALKKAELIAYAKSEHNLELTDASTKDELLALIKAAGEAAQ